MTLLENVSIPEAVRRRSFAFDRLGATAVVLDERGVIVETNEAWRLFAALNEGTVRSTGPGVSYLDVCDRAAAAGVASAGAVAEGLREILRGERGSFETEYACASPLEDRWFVLHASTAPVQHGAGVVLFHVNVTSRKLLEARLDAVDPDPAGGHADRRSGMRLVVDRLSRAERSRSRITLVKISLEGLGAIDERFGRPAVEEIIVQVYARALRVVRFDDDVGQLGHSDLVILCTDLDDEAVAGVVGRLERAMAAPFQLGASEVALRVSVGSSSNIPGSTAIGMLAAASAGDSEEARAGRRAEQQARAASRPPPDIRMPLSVSPAAGALPLQIARAQRDAVLAHSSDMVLYVEGDGTIAWASSAIRHLTGLDPSTLVGRSGFDLIHPDDRERALAELGAVSGLGDHATSEHRVVTDDGVTRWVEETVTDLIDDPNVGYLVVNLRDITERKQYEAAQARLSAIVAYSTAAIISTAVDGTVQTWNGGAEQLFGFGAEEIIGRSVALTVPAHCTEQIQEQLDLARQGGRPMASFESCGLRADGTEFDASITFSPILDPEGTVIATSQVVRDVSERVALRRRLEIDRRRLADAQRSAHLGSFELDDSARTMTWSDELSAILGLDVDGPQNPGVFRARVHPDDRARVELMLDEAAHDPTPSECVHRIVRPGGSVRWVAARTIASTDASVPGVSGTLLDITDRKQLELDLWERATHDALTGLANRARLVEQLDAAISANIAGGTGGHVGLILFDVDRFKLINDSIGHDRGDQVLVGIADVLRATLGPDQTPARFDSDSFAIVLAHLESDVDALELVGRLRTRLADGLATAALRDVEIAMYRAKDQGGNRTEWFDPELHRRVMETFAIERDLRAALEHGDLRLAFQPVLDLQNNTVPSCEALVRWRHVTRGDVVPDDFIPVAERSGLIVPLGRWALPKALAVAAEWPPGTQVAVNVSAPELAEPDLVDFVRDTLDRLDAPASRLILEITETAVVHDPTSAARAIAELRALGVRVVIDDFGTGYTSLAFLRDYTIDGLKIDRSFVSDLEHGSTAIVDAIIRMSAALGLEVIAEGVETERQLALLQELGCRYIQGYLVSRPVAADAIPFASPFTGRAERDSSPTRTARSAGA